MSAKEDHRASLSSSNPPPGTRSRSGSVVSVSVKAQRDKDASTQALDDLHTSASRSTELTAFPPPPLSATEERGRTGQQGLGSIYSRIKASITTSAEDNASPKRPGSTSSRDELVRSSWPAQAKQASRPAELADDRAHVLSPSLDSVFSTSTKEADGIVTKDAVPDQVSQTSIGKGNEQKTNDPDTVTNLPTQDMKQDQQDIRLGSHSHDRSSIGRSTTQQSELEVISADDSPSDRRQHRASMNKSDVVARTSTKPLLTVLTSSTDTSPINRVKSRESSQAHRRDDSQSSATTKPLTDTPKAPSAPDQPTTLIVRNVHTATTTSASEPKPTSPAPRRSAAKATTKQPSKALNQSFVHQMRHKILSRDFWMKDENAKVCFGCGDGFSTFRRKHHCRLCGQIFCSSCTKLVSGKPFGQASKLRVCKTCEVMMNGDDSSDDYTDDEETPSTAHPNKQIRFGDMPRISHDAPDRASLFDHNTDSDKPMTPSSSTSAFRRSRDGKRKSIQLDRTPTLPRPASSRSLKSMSGTRPRSSSQKTRRFRTQHMRSLGVVADDDVPFQRASGLGESGELLLPVLHADSVIDPDLAPFLSDDNSSEDDTPNIAAALSNDFNDQPAGFPSGLFGALKRARSYGPGKQPIEPGRSGRDAELISVDSGRPARIRRQIGSRSVSVASFNLQSPSPRASKADTFLASSDNLHAMALRGSFPFDQTMLQSSNNLFEDRTKVPDAGLNPAGLNHIKTLLRQFLVDAQIEHIRQWEKALMPVLLKCAEYVDPNIHHGDDIDIRHYVKLKKAAGGSPSDTYYVSGVVFSKNVALRSMPRRLVEPRILLISFPLVYARQQQHFMSLEPVIAQEREYLRNLVGRIKALRPSILLVQKDVSGLALEFLHEAKIVVAYNVKGSVLQAMARCTQTRIVTSAERLNTSFNALGTCGGFEVKTYVSHKIKKTVMSFSGCPRDLGCTIVLRGGSPDCLARVKWITEFMCYVTYSLKLETCLMNDECANLPDSVASECRLDRAVTGSSRIPASRPTTATEVEDPRQDASEEAHSKGTHARGHSIDQESLFKDTPAGPFDVLVRKLASRQLTASPFVKLAEPWLVLRGRDCEQRMGRIRKWQQTHQKANGEESDEKRPAPKFEIIKLDMARHAGPKSSPLAHDVLHAMREAEHDRALYHYGNIKRSWERFTSGAPDFLSPLNHQRIMVSFSIISTPTLDACDGPDLLGLDYYQEHDIDESLEQDVPLGEYVERLCNQAELPCIARRCDKRMLDHHRQYVHGDGQVSIYVQRYPSRYKGMENTILMWSECRKCQHATPPTSMSANTWKYSFGKYLELSFWATPLKPRNGICDHDIHHDHTRYFGFKSLAIRVQYDKINIVEIAVPRTTITWMVEKDLLLKNSQYTKAEERIVRFMTSVRQRITSINIDSIAPEKVEASKVEIERLAKKANEELEWLLERLHEKYTSSKYFELIPMNQAVRYVEQKVNEWDIAFADFERDYFPSERDIRRLAALQIKKAFLDREDSEAGDIEEKPLAEQHLGHLGGSEAEKSRARAETLASGIPLMTFSAPKTESANDIGNIPAIGDMPTESLFRVTSATTSQEHEQLVQTLDLAVPSSAVLTVPILAEEPSDGTNIGSTLGTVVRRDSVAQPPRPQPLEQDLVEKIEQMQVASVEQEDAEPVTPEEQHAGEGDSQDGKTDTVPLAMPPMLRSKTQPEFVTWPDPDTPVRVSTSPEAVQISQYPLVSFTSRIPVAPTALLADRIANSAAVRTGKGALHSMIPRAVKKQESKVSALAKHFEEMSREFEKERLRERRQRAAKNRESRAYPMIVSRPIVEVFRDAHEAVQERDVPEEDFRESAQADQQDEDYLDDDPFRDALPRNRDRAQEADIEPDSTQLASEPLKEGEDDQNTVASYTASEADINMSDTEEPSVTNLKGSLDLSDKSILSIFEQQQDESVELPKHEKTSLLKMLTSFWSERSASGWSPLDYPLASTDHIFENSDIIVREDEPSSLIAFTLASEDYYNKLLTFRRRAMTVDMIQAQTAPTGVEMPKTQADIDVERVMLGKTATHINYKFQHGSARIHVKVFYAESFDAIRRKCCVEDRFVESLSRSVKWDSKGGKTKSLFLKTLDERFVLKSLSTIETQAFVKFAPDYFDYMSKCLFHGLPSAIAKMLGFYQVVIRNPATGTDLNYFLQVMENVFYEGPQPMRVFDLKGSMRNRRIQATGEADEVLLDENLLDYISANPVYVRAHGNSLLDSSIKNDTLFCSKQNVMDYSLIAALHDSPRNELTVGIIDYIRTYTWDKKIESWIKDRGKHKPTVMSPKDYRTRFRKSIPRYFPLVPSPWQVFGSGTGNRLEGDGDGGFGILGARGEETIDEEEEGEDGGEGE